MKKSYLAIDMGASSEDKGKSRLEKKKAEDEIKEQIVDVSSALTEKLIEREINTEDHRRLIDSFISEMGELNDAE